MFPQIFLPPHVTLSCIYIYSVLPKPIWVTKDLEIPRQRIFTHYDCSNLKQRTNNTNYMNKQDSEKILRVENRNGSNLILLNVLPFPSIKLIYKMHLIQE